MMDDITPRHILESNAIEGIHGPREFEQSLHAWEFLIGQERLTHNVIRETQRIITANQADLKPNERGAYRDIAQVNLQPLGAHRPPAWYDVHPLMEQWLREYPKRSPWGNHVVFEAVHPFVDGNGRTGRMLLWWQQIREGTAPLLIEAKYRFDYYGDLEQDRQAYWLGMERPRG